METMPDDLEKLLSEIRKVIGDNEQFLKALAEDAGNDRLETEADEGSEETADEFEEL